MKSKIKELKDYKDEELLAEITRRSKSKKGLPIKVNCFQCSKEFWIKWNQTTQAHSKKNDYEYWNGDKTKKKICNVCLKKLYYNKPIFWKTVKDLKKRKILSGYVSNILG